MSASYQNLGTFYSKFGKHHKVLEFSLKVLSIQKKSEGLKPDEKVYRGWAMYYASQKKREQAIESLQKAIALGFKDLKWLETEPDLKNIRKEKGFKELVELVAKAVKKVVDVPIKWRHDPTDDRAATDEKNHSRTTLNAHTTPYCADLIWAK